MEVKKPQPAVGPVRLTQEQLDRVIERHKMFRSGKVGGARAALANFVMAGLSFAGQDLTGADFTAANLENIKTLNELNSAKASLNNVLKYVDSA